MERFPCWIMVPLQLTTAGAVLTSSYWKPIPLMDERSSTSKLRSASMLFRDVHNHRGNGSARAAASTRDLIVLAERLGQRWLKGLRLAMKLG